MHILDAVLLIGVIFAVLWFIIRTGLFSKEGKKRDEEDTNSSVIILKVFAVIILLIVLYNYMS